MYRGSLFVSAMGATIEALSLLVRSCWAAKPQQKQIPYCAWHDNPAWRERMANDGVKHPLEAL